MSLKIKELREYLKRHRYYIPRLMRDITELLWWKVSGKKVAIITIGSGGIGDYLWIRNYMPLVRQQGYKVILIAMAHWKEIVETFDKKNVDTVRYFESCLSPKRIETLYFKLLKADIFLNFRTDSIADFVKYKHTFNDKNIPDNNLFYEKKNNAIFKQFMPLPNGFEHTLPIIEPPQKTKELCTKPYVILVEKGNTQGALSEKQITSAINCLINNGYRILFNGDYKGITSYLDASTTSKMIDGGLFSFPQYTWLVKHCVFVITVNTSIYHFALQLHKPCVVISANEYETIKLEYPKQIVVFDKGLQQAYDNGTLQSNKSNNKIRSAKLREIECQRLTEAINSICELSIQ